MMDRGLAAPRLYWPMPNALRVLIHLPHAMKGYAMRPPLRIRELKHFRAVGRETHFAKRNQNDPVLRPVVIAQLEAPAREFGIPPDAIEQLMNGNHVKRRRRWCSGALLDANSWFQQPGAMALPYRGQ